MITSLVHCFFGGSQQQKLRRLFRKYAKNYYDFLDAAEPRAVALAGTPEVVDAWKTAFALQRALKDRQVLRVEYLTSGDGQDYLSWKSLDDIAHRVDGGWAEAEDASLARASSRYAALSNSIRNLRSKFDKTKNLLQPEALERDSQYNAARELLAVGARQMTRRFTK